MLAQMKNEMGKEHTESEGAFKAYDQFGILPLHTPESRFSLLEKIRRLFKKMRGGKEGEEKTPFPESHPRPACAHKRALYQHAGSIPVIKQ